MKKMFFRAIGFALLMVTLPASADEGMWLLPYLQQLNIKDMKAKGFKLTAEDIYSINKSAIKDAIVIFGGGCTGEIVSDQGLILTNHHCGYGSIQQHSSVEHDYLKNGFWAMSFEEEIPTPGLTVTFIRRMEDVTDQVLPLLGESMSEKERAEKIAQITGKIAANSPVKSTQKANVQSFFGGNQYFLIVTEVYSDVRLVGAPPSSIGKFGGDTDNWMWPRHTGDFSVFRVYADASGNPVGYHKDNKPYKAPQHLKISLKGYKPGDFTMIIGFPGSTERYKTSFEIDYTLNIDNPNRIFVRGERQRLMMEDMKASDKIRIQYASKYASSSNYWKNSIGMSLALNKLKVKDTKLDVEERFIQWVNADPSRKEKYGEALPLIEAAVRERTPYTSSRQYIQETLLRGTEIITAAGVVSLLFDAEGKLVELESVRTAASERVADFYKNYSLPTDRKIARRMVEIALEQLPSEYLPASFSAIEDRFGGDLTAYIDYLYDNSMFASEEQVKKFLQNPERQILLDDPAYQLRREVIDIYNQLTQEIVIISEQFTKGHRLYIAGLKAMEPGRKMYPDANFSMRLTYGEVLPYSPRDAVFYDYHTTLSGVVAKEDPDNLYEFTVSERLKELYNKRDFGPYAHKDDIPVNFISTNDITGGNSGSPVMNGKGELIGLAFDGNWEAMSGDIIFEPELQRTISVDIRYVLFIIDKYAGAHRLIDEMTIVR